MKFLVVAAAMLLVLPSQAQKTPNKRNVQKTSLTKLSDSLLQVRQSSKSVDQLKAKQIAALKAKKALRPGVAINGKSVTAQSAPSTKVKAAKDPMYITKLKAESKSFRQWHWAKSRPQYFTQSKMARQMMAAKTTKKLKSVTRKNHPVNKVARRVLNEENGVIYDVPEDGTLKHYVRGGMFYYDGTMYGYYGTYEDAVTNQSTDIVEMADGTVYIRDFLSQTAFGTWIKGTKEGNTITIPVGQRIYYDEDWEDFYYIAWAVYNDDDFEYEKDESKTDITLTIDGDEITLDDSDDEHIIGMFDADEDGDYGFLLRRRL